MESTLAVRDFALESKNLLAPRLHSPIFRDQSPISNQLRTATIMPPSCVWQVSSSLYVLRETSSRDAKL